MEDNPALLERIVTGDKTAFEKMVEENLGLVRSVAMRFTGRGCETEDLIQIGSIGLIKAIKRFDKSFGVQFSTYAFPMIAGEIRRFLRDDSMIKISRSVKENAMKGRGAQESIRKRTGREPTINEVSRECGVSAENLIYAFEACNGYESLSEYDSSEENALPCSSHEEETVNRIWINSTLHTLEMRERQVIILRYMNDKTQSVIAEMLGISQVQVSRIEKRAIEKIKKTMLSEM